jgi:lysophospholipase L1-like esterase
MATKDGALRSDYSEDGVHPVRAGYEVMEKLVKNCLALLKSEAEN